MQIFKKLKLLISIKYSYHHVSFKLLVGGSRGLFKGGKGFEDKQHIIFYYTHLGNITNIRIYEYIVTCGL